MEAELGLENGASMFNPTVNEHFIPQVYLRGFSPKYELGKKESIKSSHYTIYYYDLKKGTQSKEVPIDSVCFERNIYEVYGNDEKIIFQNHIEKAFNQLETMFGGYRRSLESKAFIEDNYKSQMFLTSEERCFWLTYITLQLLRTPQALQLAESTCKEVCGDLVNDNQARNISRSVCTPFFQEMTPDTPEGRVFNTVFEPMCDMAFGVFVDKKKSLITSDKVIDIQTSIFPCEEYERVTFPITSELCLILLGKEEKKNVGRRNFLCPMDDDTRNMVFNVMVDSAYEKIFANRIFNAKELKTINKIRRKGLKI